MNPYLFTVTFLLMMSLLTSSEVKQFSQSSLEMKCYQESRQMLAAAEELRELAHLEQLRQYTETKDEKEESVEPKPKPKPTKKRVRRSTPLNFNTARPANNSRINFFILLHNEPHTKLPKEYSLYEITARSMRFLYADQPFFQIIPDVEYRILDKFFEVKEQTLEFCTPDELSSLSLEDDELQKVFYTMLKGTKEAPSLLNFITFDHGKEPLKGQREKINLMFVDPIVLNAILHDESTTQRIIEARDKIWAEMFNQEEHRLERLKEECKGRDKFKGELKEALTQILLEGGFEADRYISYVFDLSLGDLGSILFVEDPLTKELTRQKYKSGAHIKHNAAK